MNFSFIIITDGSNDSRIDLIIDSIEHSYESRIDDVINCSYEIIVVGNSKIKRSKAKVVNFDEKIKDRWITRKKNIGIKESQYENIVLMHDYICIDECWFSGFLKYGQDFKVCMNKIENFDKKRFTDWTLCVTFYNYFKEALSLRKHEVLLPYDIGGKYTELMYISGAYWVAKKSVMQEFLLDERKSWGESEDVEWSCRVRSKYRFSFNPYSNVKIIKKGKRNPRIVINSNALKFLKSLSDKEIKTISDDCLREFSKNNPGFL